MSGIEPHAAHNEILHNQLNYTVPLKHKSTKTGQVLIGALHWYITHKETRSFVIFQMNSNNGCGDFRF
jgi:hypothetical protein